MNTPSGDEENSAPRHFPLYRERLEYLTDQVKKTRVVVGSDASLLIFRSRAESGLSGLSVQGFLYSRKRGTMRSQLVHSANKRLTNRFMLCRMTSVAAKRMTGTNGHFASSINQALEQIADLRSDVTAPAAALAVAAANN